MSTLPRRPRTPDVELLSAAVPHLKRVFALMNSANPANGFFFDAMSLRAKTLGLRLDRINFASEGESDAKDILLRADEVIQ